MSFCTGLAILGFCVAVPGTVDRKTLEDSGWSFTGDVDGYWSRIFHFTSDAGALKIGLNGFKKEYQTMILMEPAQERPKLETYMDSVCLRTKNKVRPCRISKTKLNAVRCMGGWLLASPEYFKKTPEMLSGCEKYYELFQDTLLDPEGTKQCHAQ
jgi:hypothetical protein